MPKFELFTDGACSGNPGPGGWAYLLRWHGEFAGYTSEASGGQRETTNNRMELQAVINGLREIYDREYDAPTPITVTVTTDSQYVIKGVTEWRAGWERRDWRNSKNQPVANRDLWETLYGFVDGVHEVKWVWVKGHNGHPENERCDELACIQRDMMGETNHV